MAKPIMIKRNNFAMEKWNKFSAVNITMNITGAGVYIFAIFNLSYSNMEYFFA